MLRERFPDVQLIRNDTNPGFSTACNQGMQASDSRLVLFLNPDTEVRPGALAAMAQSMARDKRLAVLGPQLFYPDGTSQSSRRRFPTFATALLESTPLEQWFPENRWARRYRMADVPDDKDQSVDWLVGACLLIRRDALESIGGFDEEFFMYSEEMDLCRRLRSAGWEVSYTSSAQVIHHEGQSSGQIGPDRDIRFNTSKVRYFRKHHGFSVAELIRVCLLGLFTARLIEEAAKWALGHRRDLRAARVRSYSAVLRSGLRQGRSAQ